LNSFVEKAIPEINNKNAKIEKLQDDLSKISSEWKDKSENDIRSSFASCTNGKNKDCTSGTCSTANCQL
jgi:hypothetical protein